MPEGKKFPFAFWSAVGCKIAGCFKLVWRYQFTLRSLLLLFTAACLLAWWFRPYAVESRDSAGNLTTQFQVRRSCTGGVIAWGEQLEYYSNGQQSRRSIQYGGAPGEFPQTQTEYWFSNGEKVDGQDAFGYLIWLITTTIEPDTWDELSLQTTRGPINVHSPSWPLQ